MNELRSDLRRKADGLLQVYGGLEGLSRNPAWLVSIVLRTWFTEAERREIVDFLSQGLSREARTPIFREMGLR